MRVLQEAKVLVRMDHQPLQRKWQVGHCGLASRHSTSESAHVTLQFKTHRPTNTYASYAKPQTLNSETNIIQHLTPASSLVATLCLRNARLLEKDILMKYSLSPPLHPAHQVGDDDTVPAPRPRFSCGGFGVLDFDASPREADAEAINRLAADETFLFTHPGTAPRRFQ